MGTSAQMQPRSKPTWLKVPLVPEEVTFITIRRRGMEKRAWRLKNRVGSMGTRTRSSMVRTGDLFVNTWLMKRCLRSTME